MDKPATVLETYWNSNLIMDLSFRVLLTDCMYRCSWWQSDRPFVVRNNSIVAVLVPEYGKELRLATMLEF